MKYCWNITNTAGRNTTMRKYEFVRESDCFIWFRSLNCAHDYQHTVKEKKHAKTYSEYSDWYTDKNKAIAKYQSMLIKERCLLKTRISEINIQLSPTD